MEEIKPLVEDEKSDKEMSKLVQDYINKEVEKARKENLEKLKNDINHIMETDIKELTIEFWNTQLLPLIVEIKKVQYLQKLAYKGM